MSTQIEIIDLRPPLEICLKYLNTKKNDTRNKQLADWHTAIRQKEATGYYELRFTNDLSILVPPQRVGKTSITDLIAPHEILIFSNYLNLSGLSTAIDLGANFGLHTVLLEKLGARVTSFEPDPITFEALEKFTKLNGVNPELVNKAVASKNLCIDKKTHAEFVRVIDNPMGSGLSSGLKSFYGNLEKFDVELVYDAELPRQADILKIDIEGSESLVFPTILSTDRTYRYIPIEVTNESARKGIYKTLSSQTRYSWLVDDNPEVCPPEALLPKNSREGSLHCFID